MDGWDAIIRQRYLGAALGGIVGAALAELALTTGELPEPRLGGRGELVPASGPAQLVVPEERLVEISGGRSPLGNALAVVHDIDLIGGDPRAKAERLGLADAYRRSTRGLSFEDALGEAFGLGGDLVAEAAAVGALVAGAEGVQVIPSRFTTYLRLPGGGGLDELQRVVLETWGLRYAAMAIPDPATAPVRVDDELPVFASDWMGAAASPTDWAVLSLCRTGGELDGHGVRRSCYLVDQEADEANLRLGVVLEDALATIDAWLEEAPRRPVVVHCHAGQSRTAFVLKAWAMERYDLSEDEAHRWLEASWPRIHRRNERFVHHLHLREERVRLGLG